MGCLLSNCCDADSPTIQARFFGSTPFGILLGTITCKLSAQYSFRNSSAPSWALPVSSAYHTCCVRLSDVVVVVGPSRSRQVSEDSKKATKCTSAVRPLLCSLSEFFDSNIHVI